MSEKPENLLEPTTLLDRVAALDPEAQRDIWKAVAALVGLATGDEELRTAAKAATV